MILSNPSPSVNTIGFAMTFESLSSYIKENFKVI